MDKDFITLEESKDELLGKVGTPQRDKYEEELNLFSAKKRGKRNIHPNPSLTLSSSVASRES